MCDDFGWYYYLFGIKKYVRLRSAGAIWKPQYRAVRDTGQFEKTPCINIISTGWFWNSLCVNLIDTGVFKKVCTQNVTGADTLEKLEYGYGIRSRLRIPESGWYPWFDHFRGEKSRILEFLKVCLELFRSYLRIIFGLKRLTLSCIFSLICRYMTFKIQILSQNVALWEGHFDEFCGKKNCFWTFLKVVLEMFICYLGIVFGLKRPIF